MFYGPLLVETINSIHRRGAGVGVRAEVGGGVPKPNCRARPAQLSLSHKTLSREKGAIHVVHQKLTS